MSPFEYPEPEGHHKPNAVANQNQLISLDFGHGDDSLLLLLFGRFEEPPAPMATGEAAQRIWTLIKGGTLNPGNHTLGTPFVGNHPELPHDHGPVNPRSAHQLPCLHEVGEQSEERIAFTFFPGEAVQDQRHRLLADVGVQNLDDLPVR